MTHSDFVPLHIHTKYSLLDGAIRISELTEKALEYKMPAVAITDHGNLFGAVDFYKKVSKAGIKPIIGCETYVAYRSRTDRSRVEGAPLHFHLILLAKNADGYRNLVAMISKAYTEGFYYKPRIDKDLLEQYSGGLIALSACFKGEVPHYLHRGMTDKAREAALWYKSVFGPDNFYLEIQDNGLKEQEEVNKQLVELSKDVHLKLVATNDCHYLRKEDAAAHDILLCIQTGKTVNDPNRMRFGTDKLYFKSPDEMKVAFSELPESILNTREIAEKCGFEFKSDTFLLPKITIDNDMRPSEYLWKLSHDGLLRKTGENPPEEYVKRLETEFDVIKNMGFSSYFLIVWDFINYARKKNIPVGPGRGSAAGSLIAYSLDITEIDPIRYNLLFERFLNPERISMPDIDVDFCRDKRGEVINYTAERYGKDHVSQIITFGTMAAKAAIRDVGRALGMPYAEVDKIAKLIPNTLNITIKEALESEEDLKKTCEESNEIKNMVDIAMRLEGLCRHASTHAAGVVISPTPLTDYAPLYKSPNEDTITTQYDMKSVESIGLLKFDFLGLKTLTVIQKTIDYLADRNVSLKSEDIPLDDKTTYDLLSSGDTTGIFQLESSGMQDILVKMSPNRFEDLIALVALYRPGPIGSGMIDDFIQRKKGLKAVKYELPQLKEILDETYGVILYQEQVMRIANKLANFSMGQADILRKAMGKKILGEMERLKEEFVKGAVENNLDEKKAVKIFDLMAMFAKYGFNKSHSAAYALIAYQTAYLKAQFPVEFLAANLSIEDNTDKIVTFIKECRQMSIDILPPDINLSDKVFTVVGSSIRFGLEAVKGVGASALESIVKTRESAPYKSLEDFIDRVDSRKVNKKVIESLIKAGAFDAITETRAMAAEDINDLIANSRSTPSLFGPNSFLGNDVSGREVREWEERELLRYEKESLGFYITSHPLKHFENDLRSIGTTKTSKLNETVNNSEVKIAGIVSAVKKKVLKDNKGTMARVWVEDDEGTVEVIIFQDLFSKVKDIVQKEAILYIKGTVDTSEKGATVKSQIVTNLKEAIEAFGNQPVPKPMQRAAPKPGPAPAPDSVNTVVNGIRNSSVIINLENSLCNTETFMDIKTAIDISTGSFPVFLKLFCDGYETTIATPFKISDDPDIMGKIESIAGKGAVHLGRQP